MRRRGKNLLVFLPLDLHIISAACATLELRQSEKRTRMASSNGRGATASGQSALPAVRFFILISISIQRPVPASNPFVI
jgi:hypothetical protein